jgi:hypothetical protein
VRQRLLARLQGMLTEHSIIAGSQNHVAEM